MGEKTFREYLKGRGLKFTKERELILKEVCSLRSHFDPEELYIGMREKGLKVSKASIYRTLPLLLQGGLIEQVERTEKHAHYEPTFGRGHHDHMLCISCGSAIEFYSEELERLQDEICRKRGFESVNHSLEIKGYCSKCRKTKK
jgi:Fur family ferric uptake transcriptional regulator